MRPKKWREAVRRTIELEPDSVTIYQMELPYNTGYLAGRFEEGNHIAHRPAGCTKRRWLDYAFEQFLAHDYEIAGSDIVARRRRKLADLSTGMRCGTAAT